MFSTQDKEIHLIFDHTIINSHPVFAILCAHPSYDNAHRLSTVLPLFFPECEHGSMTSTYKVKTLKKKKSLSLPADVRGLGCARLSPNISTGNKVFSKYPSVYNLFIQGFYFNSFECR